MNTEQALKNLADVFSGIAGSLNEDCREGRRSKDAPITVTDIIGMLEVASDMIEDTLTPVPTFKVGDSVCHRLRDPDYSGDVVAISEQCKTSKVCWSHGIWSWESNDKLTLLERRE